MLYPTYLIPAQDGGVMDNYVDRKFRDKPFAWQEKSMLRLIETNFHKKAKAPALALYTVMAEIASNQGNEAFLETTISHLSKKAGLSPNTVKNALGKLRDLNIVASQQERSSLGTFGKLKITLLMATSKASEPKPRLPQRLSGQPYNATIESNTSVESSNKNLPDGGNKLLEIVLVYASKKQILLEDEDKKRSFIKRNVRPAKLLIPYGLHRIHEVMDFLEANPEKRGNQKWTLETVGKFIDENLDNLKTKNPFYKGMPMRKQFGKWQVSDHGSWNVYGAAESEIEWK